MPYQLTAAQLELQAARKAAKQAKAEASKLAPAAAKQQTLSPEEIEKRRFLRREWINTSSSSPAASRRAKIITWNLLAQTLVRRELFPGSDCLRWGDRKPMILAELEYYSNADILCFQECDRLKDFLPALPEHSYIEAKGHGKLHGLVVLYRKARYRVRASKTVYLDEEDIHPKADDSTGESCDPSTEETRRRRGGTRKTKNVVVVVALEDVTKDGEGILVSTAHLFWHPKFAYERVRQVIILLQNLMAFRKEHSCDDWAAVTTGDFNTQPVEATYQLLTNPHSALPSEIAKDVINSRFVHKSLDAHYAPKSESMPESATTSNAGTGTATPIAEADEKEDAEGEGEGEGEGDGELPDTDERSVAGTRPPNAGDGIPELETLIELAKQLLPERGLQSAYTAEKWTQGDEATFAKRDGFVRSFEGRAVPDGLSGLNEPAYTCYTPLFKLTLDYLLLLPSPSVQVTQLLRPGTAEQLGEGLPRKGICASDHIAVGCEIAW